MPSKTVFVGNVAYDVTEDQLRGILSQAGRVASFRLVMDRETGRPRGYGFCEYEDIETAASAVRNLNNTECNGRPLRVDFSEAETVRQSEPSSRSQQPTPPLHHHPQQQQQQQQPTVMSATDAITALIGSLNVNQLFEIMSQMKALVMTNPEQARAVLTQAPPISYALLQAMIIMKVVTPDVIQQVLQSQAIQPPPMASNAPPVQPQMAQQPQVDLKSLPEEQRAALMQILQLSDAQIQALPPTQRQQVLALKQQMLASPQS